MVSIVEAALEEEGLKVVQCGVHKARMEHTCHICDQGIDIGIRHIYAFVSKYDSNYKTGPAKPYHWHIDCFNDEYKVSL